MLSTVDYSLLVADTSCRNVTLDKGVLVNVQLWFSRFSDTHYQVCGLYRISQVVGN